LTATSDLVEFNSTREIRGRERERERERARESESEVVRFAFVSPLTRRARNAGQDIASIFKSSRKDEKRKAKREGKM